MREGYEMRQRSPAGNKQMKRAFYKNRKKKKKKKRIEEEEDDEGEEEEDDNTLHSTRPKGAVGSVQHLGTNSNQSNVYVLMVGETGAPGEKPCKQERKNAQRHTERPRQGHRTLI